MALRAIQLLGSSQRPTVRQTVVLDGRAYLLELQWNGREGRWYLHLFDGAGAPLELGTKLVADLQLCRNLIDSRRPPGRLWFVDRGATGRDPGLDDLVSGGFALLYEEAP